MPTTDSAITRRPRNTTKKLTNYFADEARNATEILKKDSADEAWNMTEILTEDSAEEAWNVTEVLTKDSADEAWNATEILTKDSADEAWNTTKIIRPSVVDKQLGWKTAGEERTIEIGNETVSTEATEGKAASPIDAFGAESTGLSPTMTGLAIFAVVCFIAFISSLFFQIRSRKLHRKAAERARFPRDEENSRRPNVHEMLPVYRVSDVYDELYERGSDYECITDIDVNLESCKPISRLLDGSHSINLAIHSRSEMKVSQVVHSEDAEFSFGKAKRFNSENFCAYGSPGDRARFLVRSRSNSCPDLSTHSSAAQYDVLRIGAAVSGHVYCEGFYQYLDVFFYHPIIRQPQKANELHGKDPNTAARKPTEEGDGDYLTGLEVVEDPVIYLKLKDDAEVDNDDLVRK
ncbi:hypothetical protein ElyMa_000901000 [Elysia marginata]|uniref:Uncharacterized protein n=1 Tax=Elysia marginata TaxID=1093978 RepID=A0AAV4H7V0_9GAST|nr:hypothetical protein ElyMa_000901000 [Elysia marginata]